MATATRQYEFSAQQNALFDSLAHKMRWVGGFLTVVGVLNLVAAALLVAAVYRHEFPAEWLGRLTPDEQARLEALPPNGRLWGFALNTGVSGLLYLMIGVWTRSAASSFQRIVTTEGRDISHLMNALGALHQMYSLFFALLVLALVFMLAAVGLTLYLSYFAV
jgi:hypothetical protein